MPLVLLAFYIGLYPSPMFHYLEKPVQRIVQQVNPGYYKQPGSVSAPAPLPPNMQMPMNMPMQNATPPAAAPVPVH
jgi:hypothetical protein